MWDIFSENLIFISLQVNIQLENQTIDKKESNSNMKSGIQLYYMKIIIYLDIQRKIKSLILTLFYFLNILKYITSFSGSTSIITNLTPLDI